MQVFVAGGTAVAIALVDVVAADVQLEEKNIVVVNITVVFEDVQLQGFDAVTAAVVIQPEEKHWCCKCCCSCYYLCYCQSCHENVGLP